MNKSDKYKLIKRKPKMTNPKESRRKKLKPSTISLLILKLSRVVVIHQKKHHKLRKVFYPPNRKVSRQPQSAHSPHLFSTVRMRAAKSKKITHSFTLNK